MKTSNRREFLRDGFTTAAGFGAALGLGLHASKTIRAAQKTRGAASGDLDELRRKLEGDLLLPKDEGYDDASVPANGRYNGIRPIAVALCNNEQDVITCVEWSLKYGVPPVVRGGGHSYAGFSTTEALLVNIGRLNAVKIDQNHGTATIGGAALNRDVFRVSVGGRLILPGGTCLGVGVGGLVLGGGIGYNTHWAGLTCDRLNSSRIVTAKGNLLDLSASKHADLFWACRGGAGGSFGINTSFTFDLVEVPAGRVTYFRFDWRGPDAAKSVLSTFDSILPGAPAAFNAVARAQADTPIPGEDVRQAISVMSRGHYMGPIDDLQDLVKPLLHAAKPKSSVIKEMEFWEVQKIWVDWDHRDEKPEQHSFGDISRYAKQPLPQQVTSELVDLLAQCPSRTEEANGSLWSLGWVGGSVVDSIGPTDTAYVHRNMTTLLRPTIVWPNGEDAVGKELQVWADEMIKIMEPHTPNRSYQNFPNRRLRNWQEAYYGENFERLVEIKTIYDPDNRFRNPQSIPPRN